MQSSSQILRESNSIREIRAHSDYTRLASAGSNSQATCSTGGSRSQGNASLQNNDGSGSHS